MSRKAELIREQKEKLERAQAIENLAATEKRSFTDAEVIEIGEILQRNQKIQEELKTFSDIAEARAAADKNAESLRKAAGLAEKNPGLSTSEERDLDNHFDFMRALNEAAKGQRFEGLHRDLHEEGIREMRNANISYSESENSFVMPLRVARRMMKRDMTVDGTPTKGGYLVQDEAPRGFMDALENALVLRQLGATYLTGLVGDLPMPRAITGSDADWLSEKADSNEGGPTVEMAVMQAKRLARHIDVSNKFLLQSSINAGQWLQNYLANKVAKAIECGAIFGTGAANQPKGIVNYQRGTTAGKVAEVDFASAVPSRQKIIDMRQAVAKKNAVGNNMRFLADYDVQGILQGTTQVANYPMWLLDDSGSVIGTPAAFTNNVPVNTLIYGDFVHQIIAQWGALEFMVDRQTLFKSAETRIAVAGWFDCALDLPDAFAVGKSVATA